MLLALLSCDLRVFFCASCRHALLYWQMCSGWSCLRPYGCNTSRGIEICAEYGRVGNLGQKNTALVAGFSVHRQGQHVTLLDVGCSLGSLRLLVSLEDYGIVSIAPRASNQSPCVWQTQRQRNWAVSNRKIALEKSSISTAPFSRTAQATPMRQNQFLSGANGSFVECRSHIPKALPLRLPAHLLLGHFECGFPQGSALAVFSALSSRIAKLFAQSFNRSVYHVRGGSAFLLSRSHVNSYKSQLHSSFPPNPHEPSSPQLGIVGPRAATPAIVNTASRLT